MSDSVNVKVLNDFDRELVKVVAAVLVDPTTGQPYKVTGGGGGSGKIAIYGLCTTAARHRGFTKLETYMGKLK